MSVRNIESPMKNLKSLNDYFGQDLGVYYSNNTNRLILYPLIFSFFLLEGMAIWMFYRGPSYYLEHMAFTTIYSLHKAAGKTLCLMGADYLAHFLMPSWGAFKERTVGRQWIIWSLGLAIGFIPVRMIARKLVSIYAPEMAAFYSANPQALLSIPVVLMILIPCWIVAVFFGIHIALSRQRIQQQAHAGSALGPTNAAKNNPSARKAARLPIGSLKLGEDNDRRKIAFSDITHVTVEDHYCRINYATENGLKSQLVRLPLKELALKLPEGIFLKIHRSHVINLRHVSHLTKKGRDHKIILRHKNVELPVSRSRFKDLPNYLKSMYITDPKGMSSAG